MQDDANVNISGQHNLTIQPSKILWFWKNYSSNRRLACDKISNKNTNIKINLNKSRQSLKNHKNSE